MTQKSRRRQETERFACAPCRFAVAVDSPNIPATRRFTVLWTRKRQQARLRPCCRPPHRPPAGITAPGRKKGFACTPLRFAVAGGCPNSPAARCFTIFVKISEQARLRACCRPPRPPPGPIGGPPHKTASVVRGAGRRLAPGGGSTRVSWCGTDSAWHVCGLLAMDKCRLPCRAACQVLYTVS